MKKSLTKVKKIDIGIKGLSDSLKDFAAAWKKAEAGKKVVKNEGIYFDSVDTMRSVNYKKHLSDKMKDERFKKTYEALGPEFKQLESRLKSAATKKKRHGHQTDQNKKGL